MGSILCLLSNVMYLAEKFTMCLAVATVLTCIVFSLLIMLGMGVGLGYNYCFVDIKSKHRYVPGYYRYKVKEATTMRRTPPWRRISRPRARAASQVDQNGQAVGDFSTVDDRSSLADTSTSQVGQKRQAVGDFSTVDDRTLLADSSTSSANTEIETATLSKTVLQIQGLDLIALLSKLKSENINYTLQIVT